MSPLQDSNSQGFRHGIGQVTRWPGPWAAAIFDLEDVYLGIPGWMPQEIITSDESNEEQIVPVTWNGWDCPHFEKAAADTIVRQNNEDVQRRARQAGRVYPEDLLARFDAPTDRYRFFIIDGYDQDTGRYTGEWETYGGMAVEVEPGYSLRLYPIGAGSWIWERSETSS